MEFETNYLKFILANGKQIRWTKKIISVYIDICSIYEHQRENVAQRIGDSFYAWYQAFSAYEPVDFSNSAFISSSSGYSSSALFKFFMASL